MIIIPNLIYTDALKFAKDMSSIKVKEGEIFDFSNVYTCNPFPMLLVSSIIRKIRKNSDAKICKAANCNNTYARHMRFYKAVGINKGREFTEKYGNENYLPITKLSINELRNEGIKNLDRIQVVIENKAKLMANVLSKGNESFKKWLKYVLTEIMRNIPEHSKADEIWYCAQYWPSYDLVELAILDEGIGISNSLNSNPLYKDIIKDDIDALELALQPGVSKTFLSKNKISNDVWDNSGYGLYMVSRLCAELGGSFIIASGTAALRITDAVSIKYETQFDGTAIQIRIKPSRIYDYEEAARRILDQGEARAKNYKGAFEVASKASRSLFWDGN